MAKAKQETVRPRAPQHVIDQLSAVVETLRMTPERCSLSDETKNAIRPWLQTWSLDPLDDLLAWAKGEPGTVRRELGARRLKFYAHPQSDKEETP